MLSVILLVVIFILAYKVAPREKKGEEHIHGAGQIGLLAAPLLVLLHFLTSFSAGYICFPLVPLGMVVVRTQLQCAIWYLLSAWLSRLH